MAILYKALNFVLIVSIIFIIHSCSSSQERTPVSFTVVTSGHNSGYIKKGRLKITNKADFQKMWDNLYINFSEKPPLPDINFNNQLVIGAFFGEATSGGNSIAVKSVEMYETMIMVKIEETTPGYNCVTTDVMTQPYQIIAISKVNLPVNYATEHVIRKCD
jgi:hypothetical protein